MCLSPMLSSFFLRSHIISKTLYLDIYLASPLIVDCIGVIHCPITIAYILFLFSCSALCNVYQCIYSVLSPIFSVCRFSSLCLMLNLQACVLYLNPWPVPPDQSLCTKRLLYVWNSSKYNYWIFTKLVPGKYVSSFSESKHNILYIYSV